jgi:hypothetical protein
VPDWQVSVTPTLAAGTTTVGALVLTGGATTVYEKVAWPVIPSLLVAVTVYVWLPALAVLRSPLPDGAPLLSLQDAIPGPPVPSVQANAVDTVDPSAYVPLELETMIAAVGALATV